MRFSRNRTRFWRWWFGGQLVYGLGAGVSAAGQGVVSPEEGQTGLAPFWMFTEGVHEHEHHEHVH